MPTVVKINFKGHFIGAADCHWYMHHHVGNFCISSIGDYRPGGQSIRLSRQYTPWTIGPNDMIQIGLDRWFETMVLHLADDDCEEGVEECNCPHGGGREILMRGYQTQAEAEDGHMSIVKSLENDEAIVGEPGVITQLLNILEDLEMGVESQ